MKLSIIIVNYNTEELLEKCLESIEQESKRVEEWKMELIVVDNGSTDGSPKMVKTIINKLSLMDKKLLTTNRQSPITLKLIENKENLGFARAVNQALRQARGKVFLLLNSDTVVKPGALEKLLEFEEKVRPAVIGAKLINPDGTPQPSVFHLPTVMRAIREYWLGERGAFSKYLPLGERPIEVEAVSGGAMLISREIVEKAGFFDERYFMYFEDLDFCRRARKAGFKIYFLPSAEIIHTHGASGVKLAEKEFQWRRLMPSSRTYHGKFKHYLLSIILWTGQKWQIFLGLKK